MIPFGDMNGAVSLNETKAIGQSRFARKCVEDSRERGWFWLTARQHGCCSAWLAASCISDIRNGKQIDKTTDRQRYR